LLLRGNQGAMFSLHRPQRVKKVQADVQLK